MKRSIRLPIYATVFANVQKMNGENSLCPYYDDEERQNIKYCMGKNWTGFVFGSQMINWDWNTQSNEKQSNIQAEVLLAAVDWFFCLWQLL